VVSSAALCSGISRFRLSVRDILGYRNCARKAVGLDSVPQYLYFFCTVTVIVKLNTFFHTKKAWRKVEI
jgi:hypothetical protein